MIKFDLLKKEELGILLEGFETPFLQIPMKYAPRDVLKFIPNGFRVEKLGRLQLIKVYTEALFSGEVNFTSYIKNEVEHNFELAGLDSYMVERLGKDYPISTFIAEISSIVFDFAMVLPAHIVLMLYGIECSPEEKELSEKLYKVFYEQKKQAEQKGFELGCSKSEARFANDLEAEQKKNAKLQKSLDALKNKKQEEKQPSKETEKEIGKLTDEIAEKDKKIKELQELVETQDNDLFDLYEELKAYERTKENLSQELNRVLAEMQTLKTQKEEAVAEAQAAVAQAQEAVAEASALKRQTEPIPQDKIKAACVEAVKLFSSKNAGKNAVLANVEKLLTEGENVKNTWLKLNDATFGIIEEVNTALQNNSFELQMLDKFSEIETLLLLESAIQRSLRELAYRAMASATVNDDAEENFFEQ